VTLGEEKASFHRTGGNAVETDSVDYKWTHPNFYENRRHISPEEQEKYAGRHVAFSWDGTHIVASGADFEELDRNVTAAGLDPSRIVWGYMDDPNVSNL
jgi:hypothetical protein